jgi:hypothetical protein
MATLTLKNKKHLGSGNFEYTFECFCSPKPLKEIKAFGDIHYQQERRLIFRNTNASSPIQRVFEPAFLPFLDLERSGPGRLALTIVLFDPSYGAAAFQAANVQNPQVVVLLPITGAVLSLDQPQSQQF